MATTAAMIQYMKRGGAHNDPVLRVNHMHWTRALPVMSSEDHLTTDTINQVYIEKI